MALAGLKKQFNKANQYMNEKIGGVEGTKFNDEYTQLERRTDLTCELVDDLINRTKEYLQPNPASRTKLMVSSKLKGVPGKPHSYPQPEGILADAMCKYGKEINEESGFAKSLIEMGEALREMAEVKYALEDNVKQNFLEPLTHLQAKDLKDVLFHRKKLEGRRLDYDCKKRKKQKGTHFTEEEIRMAEEKLEESYNLASMGMHNLLQNEVEQMSQICVLSEALYEYHSQCANILESLNARLMEIKNDASLRTFQPYIPKKLQELNLNAPTFGHDDLSPGDTQRMNGSNFYCSSLTTNESKKNGLPACNSTTSYLLGNSNFSTNSETMNSKNHSKTLPHSKSLLNVSSADTKIFPETKTSNNWNWDDPIDHNQHHLQHHTSPLPSPVRSPARTPTDVRGPSCQALYDFDAENENEISFKEGDIIQLVSQVDDNWYEGNLNGRNGLFPVSYVQVLVPL
ncbi:endophilin-A-like protein [Sarcoptes scabiei]|uniref:Endophilin-A n=1 Tax=Sarcoptes scabiei TaxID=52283 RepID=A0A131ZZG1_SARSC|nr:endophilin-A-like protein [Sarcoptes scabiei]